MGLKSLPHRARTCTQGESELLYFDLVTVDLAAGPLTLGRSIHCSAGHMTRAPRRKGFTVKGAALLDHNPGVAECNGTKAEGPDLQCVHNCSSVLGFKENRRNVFAMLIIVLTIA